MDWLFKPGQSKETAKARREADEKVSRRISEQEPLRVLDQLIDRIAREPANSKTPLWKMLERTATEILIDIKDRERKPETAIDDEQTGVERAIDAHTDDGSHYAMHKLANRLLEEADKTQTLEYQESPGAKDIRSELLQSLRAMQDEWFRAMPTLDELIQDLPEPR